MKVIALVIVLFIIPFALAQPINPKALDEVTLKITQSGTLVTTGFDRANLTIYIPQEGVQSIIVDTNGGTWKYIYDKFGNKIVLMEWGRVSDSVKYRVETLVKNNAKHLASEKKIGSDNTYLDETHSIIISDDIKKTAYPYEKNLAKAAELSAWVNKYMTYDLTYSGKTPPSDVVFKERRGVCAEYATLLTSLLRASGIPTRYIVGYAYSNVQNKFEGHAWVEVLTNEGWVPFDPTWLQGGYLDASHIKTGNLLDNNQTETLSYTGGKILWQKDNDVFELLDYKEKDVLKITLSAKQTLASNENGYIKADLTTNGCGVFDIMTSSCVDKTREKMIDIYDANRSVWFCGSDVVYWFFAQKDLSKKYFSCPIVIFDQTGASSTTRIEFRDTATISETFITGPETVNTNEEFRLNAFATENYIFYSPVFGEHESNVWDLSIKKPDDYNFYLYYNGALARKTVTAVERKEFDIKLQTPLNATLKNSFIVNVSVKNLLGKRIGNVVLNFDNYQINDTVIFNNNDEKTFSYNLTAEKLGNRKISVYVSSDTLSTYSASIYVYEIRQWWQNITDPLARFFNNIAEMFSNIFG